MAYKCREEIVGKRFLSVSAFNSKLKSAKISDWGWRAGVIRAATHKDNTHPDLQVLVEYDGVEWQRREWISIYKEGLFHLFLVELNLVWADRRDPFSNNHHGSVVWPALTFAPLVALQDIPGHLQPVEFLLDHELAFKDYKLLKPFKEWEGGLRGDYSEVRTATRRWTEQQDGQRILLTTPSVLVGYRVEVYRAEGTTQWYTAVIVGYNEATRDLTVTDDTVLEEHNEDPALVQMRLIGDGVVESIMRGENVGITSRRSRSTVLQTHHHHNHHHQQQSRVIRGLSQQVTSATAGSVATNSPQGRKLRTTGKLAVAEPPVILQSNCPTTAPPTPEPEKVRPKKRKTSEGDNSKPKYHHKEDLENKQNNNRRKNLCNRVASKKKVLEEANNSKLRGEEEEQVRGEEVAEGDPQEKCSLEPLQHSSKAPVKLLQEEVVDEVQQQDGGVVVSVRPPEALLRIKDCGEQQVVSVKREGEEAKEKVVVGGEHDQQQHEEVREESMPASEAALLLTSEIPSEEDDCVIVSTPPPHHHHHHQVNNHHLQQQQQYHHHSNLAGLANYHQRNRLVNSGTKATFQHYQGAILHHHHHPNHVEERERDDDVVPLSSSSPFASSRMELSDTGSVVSSLRFADDRSDSGVSSLRSGSGDERSGSRSSALSLSEDSQLQAGTSSAPQIRPSQPPPPPPSGNTVETPVRVWRDPSLLLESEPHVRHIHSVQHQTLLMSHPSAPPASSAAAASAPPHTSAAALFPPAPPPHTLMSPHPLHAHPHAHMAAAAAAGLYHHALPVQDMLMLRQRYAASLPPTPSHLSEELAMEVRERERALLQDRMIREQRSHEAKEKERMERDKMAAERKREEQEREEKERQEKELNNHFEKSLRSAQKNREQHQWNNILGGRPPQPRTSSLSEDDRKRAEQEHHQRHMSARDHRSYYPQVQRPPSVPSDMSKYPPPPAAHSRISSGSSSASSGKTAVSEKLTTMHPTLQKNDLNIYHGYPVCHPQSFFEPKNKMDHHKVSSKNEHLSGGGGGSGQMTEMKNSVIVKHDGKSGGHHASIPHSPSPKLRNDLMPHYLSGGQQSNKAGLYEYRSPTQSPHHQMNHHLSPEAQNLGKSSGGGGHSRMMRQSPQQDVRYRSNSESQAMIYPSQGKYPFMTQAQPQPAQVKPKVSSPAPHHIYGKPSSGIVSVVPVSKAPSPYQPVSQYHPPHVQTTPHMTCPPPAHSSRTTSYDRPMYSPNVMTVKLPTASTPLPVPSRSHQQYNMSPAVGGVVPPAQTQPLDLGVSSNKYDSALSPKRKAVQVPSGSLSPVCLEVKKRRLDVPVNYVGGSSCSTNPPQLARVSEPSPLVASAATTITTVVNTAAFRATPTPPQPAPIVEPIEQPPAPPTKSDSPAPVTVTLPPEESPVKVTPTPSSVDSEKSNSPGPNKTASHTVRHLKKAWLQRHTGEDLDNSSDVVGSGSCVTLPIQLKTTPPKENPVNSIHSVGSMAVNSISKTTKRKVKEAPPTPNGVPNEPPTTPQSHKSSASNAGDDSSSSDQERGRKSPPKRKPPKVKRKKGAGPSKKPPDDKKSNSDSEKESGSDKDSDSGGSTSTKKAVTTASSTANSNTGAAQAPPRKRGRRPKSSKNDKGEEPRPKKSKEDSLPQRDPFRKPPVGQLKKTGESFLQDGPCFEVAPKLAKCRECRWTPNQRSKNMPNIFCRFYAFRRLRYTKNGQLAIAGFSDPHKDALEDDLKLWLPDKESPPSDLDLETSRFLLKQVGDHFCDLLVQERDAHQEHMSDDKTVAWKRVVQGVREMCDVCETTLFNFHWACRKCGFVVCLDCYKSRKSGSIKIWSEAGKDRDEFSWLLCTNRQAHDQEKLMLTQIIAGESLTTLGRMVHEMRDLWNIEQYCACPAAKEVTQKSNNITCKEVIKNILMEKMNGVKKEPKDEDVKSTPNGVSVKDEKPPSTLSWLADVALSNEDKKNEESSSDSEDGNYSTLRELLIRPSHKPNGSRAASPVSAGSGKNSTNKKGSGGQAPPKSDMLDNVISSVIEDNTPKVVEPTTETKSELKHFLRRYNWQAKGRQPIPIRIMTLTESKMLYPDVPHSWLCDGKLLRLNDPVSKDNYKIFQDQWKRGQPVIVSDVTKSLDSDLWNPDSFARDFGDEKNDLVNCMTGNLVPNQPMRKFWEGFDHFSKRLKDERGNPMLLKLKDWPPGEDFSDMLPSRYNDLMKVLPLGEYTNRNGRLNLASRLPDCFVRPDLGPKMYNAYGSALHPSKGTTNLHLDISDAVNVMVYVGIPKDGDSDEHIKEAFRAIDEAGCDILTRRRVRDKGELPGALWHIYNARDADKIRDLLNKVVVEKGGRLEPHNDPIHDQSCYLDGPLRERLYKEYGVEGYAIVQCLGDAVFIPAGAPHQVRNLHNCIKVAEDFVSPENVSHCFHLTQEFRDLSDTHSNHEDKLQIKNIIYHAVKDSLASLSSILSKHMKGDKNETNGSAGLEKKAELKVEAEPEDCKSPATEPIKKDSDDSSPEA